MKFRSAAAAVLALLAISTASHAQGPPPDRILPVPDIDLPDRAGRARKGVRCAAEHVNAGLAHAQPLSSRSSRSSVAAAGTVRTVPVAFHVVYASRRGQTVGNVSLQQIQDQIDVLNDAYAERGFSFELASVDRTLNSKWFTGCYNLTNESAMKQQLAIDPPTTLNIYTCQPGQSILGYAYYPSAYPEDSFWHGAVLHFETLPGGNFDVYSEGDTGTHEVGHYLGLYHTFAGGCTATGDHVADTPAEASPAYGCPQSRDTCVSPGLDPIHNFMDYTEDACMFEFTGGQAALMDEQVAQWRPSLGSPTPGGCGDGSCDENEECSCEADCGSVPSSETACSDGIDNDCDGAVDCTDSNCSAAPACSSCSGSGTSCTSDGDCCSNRCKGKPGSRHCN